MSSEDKTSAHAEPVIMQGLTDDTEGLGRFGNHPDPATDFCIEVEKLESRLHQAQHGLLKPGTEPETVAAVLNDIQRAMDFRVGGDEGAVAAKGILRGLEDQAKSHPPTDAAEIECLTEKYISVMERFVTMTERAEKAEARAAELEAALRRIAALDPEAANARSARDLHLTVRAIAHEALSDYKTGALTPLPDAELDAVELEIARLRPHYGDFTAHDKGRVQMLDHFSAFVASLRARPAGVTDKMVEAAFNALPRDAIGTIETGEMKCVLEAALTPNTAQEEG